MALRVRNHPCTVDLEGLPWSDGVEFEGGQRTVRNGPGTGLGLLPAQRSLGMGMAAVHNDAVARDINRREKRQPHDVVPMQMGQEHMVGLGYGGAVPCQHMRAKRPHTVPRSRMKCSLPPVSICTQLEWPPKVPATSKPRLSTYAAMAPGCERLRPCAPSSARTILARTSGAVSDTGIEPRVPQQRSFMCPPGRGSGNVRVHRQHQIEMADLENFCHDGRERGDGDQSLLGLDLFGRQKQHPQADTADIDHAREIKHASGEPVGVQASRCGASAVSNSLACEWSSRPRTCSTRVESRLLDETSMRPSPIPRSKQYIHRCPGAVLRV